MNFICNYKERNFDVLSNNEGKFYVTLSLYKECKFLGLRFKSSKKYNVTLDGITILFESLSHAGVFMKHQIHNINDKGELIKDNT